MRPCEIFDDESAAIVVQHQVDPGGYFFHEEQKICETLGGSQWSLCFIASITAAAGLLGLWQVLHLSAEHRVCEVISLGFFNARLYIHFARVVVTKQHSSQSI